MNYLCTELYPGELVVGRINGEFLESTSGSCPMEIGRALSLLDSGTLMSTYRCQLRFNFPRTYPKTKITVSGV
jgi:hypothetical protein